MKKTIWQICCGSVIMIALLSFFVLLPTQQFEPYFFNTPYIFGIGILLTALLVFITYIAQKNFPFNDDIKS